MVTFFYFCFIIVVVVVVIVVVVVAISVSHVEAQCKLCTSKHIEWPSYMLCAMVLRTWALESRRVWDGQACMSTAHAVFTGYKFLNLILVIGH